MIYIADTKQGVLREKAGNNARKPLPGDYGVYDHYREDHDKWERHIASLKQYPIIGDGWEDQREYQDSDFELEEEWSVGSYYNGKGDNNPDLKWRTAARLKQPEESQERIKEACEKMYVQIKEAEENLKKLRGICKHPNTFEGNYSYRVGSITPATICSDCNHVIKVHF